MGASRGSYSMRSKMKTRSASTRRKATKTKLAKRERRLGIFPLIAILRDHIPATKTVPVTTTSSIVSVGESEYRRQVLTTAMSAIAIMDAKKRPNPPKNILQEDLILAVVLSPVEGSSKQI